jgi:16S rRNA (guanine527-N7)-methyltransferase
MEVINKYFPRLTENQRSQFAQLPDLYADWNSKINVISRKDISEIMTHHVLHSLAIAKYIQLNQKQKFWILAQEGVFPVFL